MHSEDFVRQLRFHISAPRVTNLLCWKISLESDLDRKLFSNIGLLLKISTESHLYFWKRKYVHSEKFPFTFVFQLPHLESKFPHCQGTPLENQNLNSRPKHLVMKLFFSLLLDFGNKIWIAARPSKSFENRKWLFFCRHNYAWCLFTMWRFSQKLCGNVSQDCVQNVSWNRIKFLKAKRFCLENNVLYTRSCKWRFAVLPEEDFSLLQGTPAL